ncbi:MAG: NUDIX hydrolase [Firmicutes bacterium]|nr:NUDIX hydrolase [Bacillota bacterium]
MESFAEKTISSRRIYEGKMINLRIDTVALPDGAAAEREIVEHPGAVAVVALTAGGEILLVRQFRKPIDRVTLEIPAGKLKAQEDPFLCAQRELEEETGHQAKDWRLLFTYFTTPGFSDEIMYLYLAQGLTATEQCLDPDEFIEVVRAPIGQARQMITTGEIQDAKTIIGILMASELINKQF